MLVLRISNFQGATIRTIIAGPKKARNPNLDIAQRIASYVCVSRL